MSEKPPQAVSESDFDSETIIVNLQILPVDSKQQRLVIVAVGIRNDLPLVQSHSLADLTLPKVITEALDKLREEFPNRKRKQAERQEQQHVQSLQHNYQQRKVTPPDPAQATPSQSNSQQLTLF